MTQCFAPEIQSPTFGLEKLNQQSRTADLSDTLAFNLEKLNQYFEDAHPRDILAWCINNIPTGLVQSSGFNVNGMAIMDILYRELQPVPPVPVLFLDTLHHFRETLELVHRAEETYNLDLKIYRVKDIDSRKAFAARYGVALWHRDVEKFHYLTKIEPLERGLTELGAVGWITGRRRDQAQTRAQLPIFELDKKQRLKINPLATWTRKDSWAYIVKHGVIYNPLHDQGYPSVGDEPLTTQVGEGEGERAGRWRGSAKTECGMHI